MAEDGGRTTGAERGRGNVAAQLAAARAGDRRALARLLTVVERGGDGAAAVLSAALHYQEDAHTVGITGPPGAGKSTLTAALAQALRVRGDSVAILAVDPSSPRTGGALLGDRVRMGALHGDVGVFVRSLASRGSGGGLSDATAGCTAVLAACGFAHVLVETVGAGQGELDVAAQTHSTVVVLAPGLGDDVQALKAGILEVADVLVANKADRDGADQLVADLTFTLGQAHPGAAAWHVPVIPTVATTGRGVERLVEALDAHRASVRRDPSRSHRALLAAEQRLLRAAGRQLVRELEHAARRGGLLEGLARDLAERRLTLGEATAQLIARALPGAQARAPRETL